MMHNIFTDIATYMDHSSQARDLNYTSINIKPIDLAGLGRMITSIYLL